MSYFARDKRKRCRDFDRVYGDGDFESNGWKVERIHQIPDPLVDGHSVDFWIRSEDDVMLVTLRKSEKQTIHFNRRDPRSHIHITLNSDFVSLSDDSISALLRVIRDAPIPRRGAGYGVVRQTKP